MEQLRPLEQLTEQTDRREAMGRCIGPLTILGSIQMIDFARDNDLLIDKIDTVNRRYNFVENGFYSSRVSQDNVICLMSCYASEGSRIGDHTSDILTDVQNDLFGRYTNEQSAGGVIQQALLDQADMLGSFLLPSYVTLKSGDATYSAYCAKTPYRKQWLDKTNALLAPDFNRICRVFSFAPNGVLASIDFDPDAEIDLITKAASGSVTIAKPELVRLRTLLREDTGVASDDPDFPSRLTGSIGCPASIIQSKVNMDDFTSDQWEMFLNGKKPVARYDAQKSSLTFLRHPIVEYNKVVSEAMQSLHSID